MWSLPGLGRSLYAKRLERGRYLWPSAADVVTITPIQLRYMLDYPCECSSS
ncbi:IS66 family insertion sequence element accessory protein TnpB [Bradyrhizobium sp. NBAIM03]|nr:IS66 family insertion sequence element accessory protein TnpB [Bradyrhizobium sp. NBAIM03]